MTPPDRRKKTVGRLLTVLLLAVCLAVFAAVAFAIKARLEGDRLYAMYKSYTQTSLENRFDLKRVPIKPGLETIHPWKTLKLFKVVASRQEGNRLARLTELDATIGLFMRMYTLVIRPDYAYNLPIFSADFIFIGGKRVFIIELIDPIGIEDGNFEQQYKAIRAAKNETLIFEPSETSSDWARAYLKDASIHIKADRTWDGQLFDIYKTYLNAYLKMVEKAVHVDRSMEKKRVAGTRAYVDTLLSEGGPAVDVFEMLLGPRGQAEFVRSVLFGVE